jgi:hypothetical protein
VTVAVWNPALYQTAAGLIGLAVACGVTVLLAGVARAFGRRAEKRLNAEWGGKPTTLWLRHRDGNLDGHTTTRYHGFLAANVPGWNAPTEDGERADPAGVDALYESAVRWLLGHTRDRRKFPLVFAENVAYGFARNCYGLKPIAVVIAPACVLANVGLAMLEYSNAGWTPIFTLGLAALGVSLAAVVAWLVTVTPIWIRDAGDGYAHALLLTCEGDQQPVTVVRKQRPRAPHRRATSTFSETSEREPTHG